MSDKSIYDLDLHEIIPVETNDRELWTSAMRVPGGWIYRSFSKQYSMMSCVFVPFDNTFWNDSNSPNQTKGDRG